MLLSIVNQPFDLLLPPYQNSIALWTYHTAPHMAKACDVVVFGRKHDHRRTWLGQNNVEYRFMQRIVPNGLLFERSGSLFQRFGRRDLPYYASRLYYLDYITQVAWNLRRRKVDVVHIHNFTQFVPIVRAIHPKVKIALHMNCEWLNQLDYDVIKERIAQCDLVLGSSDYIADKVRARYPEFSDRCGVLYNGVDVELFHPGNGRSEPSDCLSLLFVGRISPEKGVHNLIEAFALIARRFPNAHLNLAGPVASLPLEYIVGVSEEPEIAALARYYEEDYGVILRRLVEENNLTERVHFLGVLSQAELVSYYQSADLLLNPSYSESFGMSLVEALAAETAVIATRVGGMVNIVDEEETGLLVPRGDVEALAGAMARLLDDPALRKQMGKIGRQRVIERFSWPKVAASAVEKYTKLLE